MIPVPVAVVRNTNSVVGYNGHDNICFQII